MRGIYATIVLALAIAFGGTAAESQTEVSCPSSPLPSESSATDKDQLALLSNQATACVREKKPALAVALLSEVIRRAPTEAAAYLNRGGAQAFTGELAPVPHAPNNAP
jgi:hypothetical protein